MSSAESSDSDSSQEESVQNDDHTDDESSDDNTSSEDDGKGKVKLADKAYREMPFESLLQLQRKLGAKMYNEAIFGKAQTRTKDTTAAVPKKGTKRKPVTERKPDESDSDGPPEEKSSKVRVLALGMEKQRKFQASSGARDPRFDPKQGYFSGRQFRKEYGFINELRTGELTQLKQQLKQSNDPREMKKIKIAITRTENQMREYQKEKEKDLSKESREQEIRKAIQEGRRPVYEAKSTQKARELVEMYDKLKESGKLAKHIVKRQKKVTAKDRRRLDFAT